MNKLTEYLLSFFTFAINSDLCAVNQFDYYEPRKRDPRTRSIRLAVESVIGKNYQQMFNDKLKDGRKLKFYNIDRAITLEELAMINEKLSVVGVVAVIHKTFSIVVKYKDI